MPFPESPQDPSLPESASPGRADGSPSAGADGSRSAPAAPSNDLASRAELKSVFSRALELSPDERLCFLAELAEERPAIAEEIGSLLAAHDQAGDFGGGQSGAVLGMGISVDLKFSLFGSLFKAAFPIFAVEPNFFGGSSLLSQVSRGQAHRVRSRISDSAKVSRSFAPRRPG